MLGYCIDCKNYIYNNVNKVYCLKLHTILDTYLVFKRECNDFEDKYIVNNDEYDYKKTDNCTSTTSKITKTDSCVNTKEKIMKIETKFEIGDIVLYEQKSFNGIEELANIGEYRFVMVNTYSERNLSDPEGNLINTKVMFNELESFLPNNQYINLQYVYFNCRFFILDVILY